MYIGKGNTVFREHEGNFDIKDDVTEKIPLRKYNMKKSNDGVNITLSDSDGTKVWENMYSSMGEYEQ